MESQAERKIEVRSIFRSLLSMRESILFIVIVLSFIGMSFASPYFLSPGNLESMFLGLSVEGIICIGMVILLVSGGLDLSVGSNLAFTGVVVGLSMTNGIPILPSIIIALIAAFLAGFLNGILIAKMNLNPFITTLGMQMFLKGAMLLAANGKSVLGLPEGFNNIGQGRLIGIQYPVFILIILVIVFEIVLRRSRILRTSYYVGGNENAARLSGIKVNRVKIAIYSLTGIMAGIAGIIITARFGSSSVTIGPGVELRVLAACIIGGASLNGGEGTVLGAFLGAFFMQLLSTSLNLLNVNVYVQTLLTGAILILAILLDQLNEKRKSARTIAHAERAME
ncbi:MAG: ABC transporter permease [Spirochaetia bacterium]|jgi:ribose transport system permease protein